MFLKPNYLQIFGIIAYVSSLSGPHTSPKYVHRAERERAQNETGKEVFESVYQIFSPMALALFAQFQRPEDNSQQIYKHRLFKTRVTHDKPCKAKQCWLFVQAVSTNKRTASLHPTSSRSRPGREKECVRTDYDLPEARPDTKQ